VKKKPTEIHGGMDEVRMTISQEAVATSLPHRGLEEQKGIRRCFIGVTTWQMVCKDFGIDWGILPTLAD
jgi:hypothetical protein